MKQTMKRLGALGLALLLGALGSIPALAAELPEKDEVIYVNLSPEGEAGAIYVVNSYDLPAETTVTDYGNYRRVKNLTTTAPLTQEGKKITFTAPAGKFYFQGSLDSSRVANCSRLISREKNTTAFLENFPAWSRMFRAKEVLPMPGRAARRTSSVGWNPVRVRSRSPKPVAMPGISEPEAESSWRRSHTSTRILLKGSKPWALRPWRMA